MEPLIWLIGCVLTNTLCLLAAGWLWRTHRHGLPGWGYGLGFLSAQLVLLLWALVRQYAFGFPLWAGFLTAPMAVAIAVALQAVNATGLVLALVYVNRRQAEQLESQRVQLQQSQQQVRDASRSRGDFLARMSHELLTPIHQVLGMAHLALGAQPSPKVAEYLHKIRQAGGHLMGVVNDVLNFAVVDSGQLQLECSDFSLDQVLNNAVQLTQERAHERGLELHREVDRNLPRYVHGDALCIGQIILNYLNNAIKFTEQGHIILRVLRCDTDASVPTGVRLRFEVSDTGIGLSAEQIARLFASFEQVETSNNRRFGGTGLGLATSKQLAQLMGGDVGVVSEAGLGSTFWLEAPLREVANLPGLGRDAGQPAADDALSGLQILVVDDSAFNLEVTRAILEQSGAQVMTATDGAQAVSVMRAVAFDCVLMDMQMPIMDGLAATRAIRQDPALAKTLVIGLTANTYREHRAQCLDAGMHSVLSKAIEPAQLVATILDFLARLGRLSDRPRAGAEQPVVEWVPDELEKFVGTNPATQQRLLGRYVAEGERLCAVMVTQQHRGDWLGIGESAHSLKSSSKAVGALPLAQWCQQLEEAGRQGDGAQCIRLLADIQAGFVRVQALIQARLQANPVAPT